MTPVACIYHKDCIDGTTAAAVVLRKSPDVRLFPLAHGRTQEETDAVFSEIATDAQVYIVDTTAGLEECVARGISVTVIDHHISEHERVKKMAAHTPNITYIFDNEKSGASLAWSYLFPDESVPELITYVEDSDLWLQRYSTNTEHAMSYLSLLRNDPSAVLECLHADIASVLEPGALLARKAEQEVERFIEFSPVSLMINGAEVLAFNITNHQSTCGNILSQRFEQTVALYTIVGDEVRLSFRCQDTHEPSALDHASSLGGGGHRNAAGARMSLRDFIGNINIPTHHA